MEGRRFDDEKLQVCLLLLQWSEIGFVKMVFIYNDIMYFGCKWIVEQLATNSLLCCNTD